MRGGALSISGKERDWVGPSLIFGPLGARDRIRAEVGPVDGVTRPATEEEDSGCRKKIVVAAKREIHRQVGLGRC